MSKNIEKYINMFLGTNANQRFRRGIMLIIIITLCIIAALGLRCSINSQGEWSLEFFPAAKVEIKK